MRVRTVHRITGPHLLLDGMGAAIWLEEIRFESAFNIKKRVSKACAHFNWGEPSLLENDTGYSIAIEAPIDQLYAACVLLEWACEDEEWSSQVVERIQREEKEHLRLRSLYVFCLERNISYTVDEDYFCIGYGLYAQSYPWTALPVPEKIKAPQSIPVVAITGTNGKTTTTRMLSSISKEAGYCVGATSSDGVVIDGETIVSGDWTGAGAARKVLRNSKVDFAILETARGGLMRRGMVIRDVDVVGITNVSRDHFGSWGIESLISLQRAKLSIVFSLRKYGVLVLNKEHTDIYDLFLKEFSTKRPDIRVVMYTTKRTISEIVYCNNDIIYVNSEPLCSINEIPLTLDGHAKYNLENALMAITIAHLQGISATHIREGLSLLLPDPKHSQGRSNIFFYNGGTVIVDFAHNEGGITAMVDLVKSLRPKRSFMVLGQAADRSTSLLKGMAYAAANLSGQHYWIKQIEKHTSERSAKETALILQEAMKEAFVEPEKISICESELVAAEEALQQISEGDVLLFFSHTHYEEVVQLLTRGSE
ncbi:MAG: hypothetical protein CL916_01520 [Deltaproteobacteria bacterium]|nr:hypothetical protein [Deltaproteobacteria bacterium]